MIWSLTRQWEWLLLHRERLFLQIVSDPNPSFHVNKYFSRHHPLRRTHVQRYRSKHCQGAGKVEIFIKWILMHILGFTNNWSFQTFKRMGAKYHSCIKLYIELLCLFQKMTAKTSLEYHVYGYKDFTKSFCKFDHSFACSFQILWYALS